MIRYRDKKNSKRIITVAEWNEATDAQVDWDENDPRSKVIPAHEEGDTDEEATYTLGEKGSIVGDGSLVWTDKRGHFGITHQQQLDADFELIEEKKADKKEKDSNKTK